MAKKILVFGLIFAVTLALYLPVFKIFFTGDDFFHFKVSMTDGSFLGLVRLFGFYPFESRGIAFYRPLFRELTYNLSYHFFGLNAFPLRVLSMVLHLANVFLLYVIVKRVSKSEKIALLSSFFFSLSAANSGAIYYLAGGLQAQGATLFAMACLILFPKHKVWAFVTFILALMSHELAVVTPLLIIGVMFLNKNLKLKFVWFYFIVIVLYLYAEFRIIGFSKSEVQYQLVLAPKTLLNSLSWYTVWSLGLPETLIDLVGPGLKLNPNLMKNWGDTYRFIFPAFLALGGSFVLAVATNVRKLLRTVETQRQIIFFVVWFLAGISTVIFLPQHRSTYYLALSLPAFWVAISYFVFGGGKLNRIFSVVFLLGFVVLNVFTTKNMNTTYWAAQRGRLAEKIVSEIKSQYPTLPSGAVVFIKNDSNYPFIAEDWGGTSKQASLILSGSDALQLLYHDPKLKVYYEDLGGIPAETNTTQTFDFVAKIN